MCSNGGNSKIEEQGNWPGVGKAYRDGQAITKMVYPSDAIKRGYHVFFNSRKENAFLIEDYKGRVVRYPVEERGL